MIAVEKAVRVRDDVGKSSSGVPEVEAGGDYDYDRVIFDCPECGRVHYVSLECPPANAAMEYYRASNGKVYRRVVESVE